MERMFDLNIEKILENWTIYDRLREIISNALDEQAITKTKDIQIAMNMFLRFTRSKILDDTKYGKVIEKEKGTAFIYINRVKVAEEEIFSLVRISLILTKK